MNTSHPKVLIVDFGSQYSRIISKKIRQLGVYSELLDPCSPELLKVAQESSAIVFSGGPCSVEEEYHISINSKILSLQKPILGVCYGKQLIHKVLGGQIDTKNHSEFGFCELIKTKEHPLLDGVPERSKIWCSHNDSVIKQGDGFEVIAKTDRCISVSVNDALRIYTVQFHPEISQCEYGLTMISNFIFKIAGIQSTWKTEDVVETKTKDIVEKVGASKVLLALSGGVDSSVLAYLLAKSLNEDQIYPTFIDHGLLRKGEKELIVNTFSKKFKNFVCLDKQKEFFAALKGVIDPEKKRKIIGKLFIDFFSEYANQSFKSEETKILAQGTIYSDLIESGQKSKNSTTVKSHHNVVGLFEAHDFIIIEPLSNLFKDEVKELGKSLNVPDDIINKPPFPGPGLAIRVIGEVVPEKVKIIQDVDQIFQDELTRLGLRSQYSQAFSVLLNTKSIGVKGDLRSYEYVAALRAVKTDDFMTAEVSAIDIEKLISIGSKISNAGVGVCRVVYDLTSKPPGTIEWE